MRLPCSPQAYTSFHNQAMREVPKDYYRDLLARCLRVTRAEVFAALRAYLLPLFDPARSVVVAVCPPNRTDEVAGALADGGFEVERRTVYAEAEAEVETKAEVDGEKLAVEGEGADVNADAGEKTPPLVPDEGEGDVESESPPVTPPNVEPVDEEIEINMSEKMEELALDRVEECRAEDDGRQPLGTDTAKVDAEEESERVIVDSEVGLEA